MVEYKETHAAIQRDKWEQSGQIVINEATRFIGECSEAKYICNLVVVIHCNQCRALGRMVCRDGSKWWGIGLGYRCRCGRLFGSRAPNAMSWAFHMAFSCGGTAVEILVDQFFAEIGTPFEEAAACCFEKGGYGWVTQGLVCKLNGIGPCLNRVCETNECRVLGEVGGTTFTGAGSWQEIVSWGGPHPFSWDW
jgi:hypothetical protein